MISYTVTKQHDGLELFNLLEQVYPDFDPRDQDAAFKYGDIMLNGEDAYGDDVVREDDALEIFLPGDIVGIDIRPRIIYQDENFVVADKPAGLLSISDDDEPSAVGMIEEIMKERGEYNLDALMVPYLVYPLDRYVSGVLLLAKHEEGYLFLVEALTQRRLSRYFVCPVRGVAEESDELMAYYKKDKAGKRAHILGKFEKNAKPIVTRYSTISTGETMSLLDVRTITNGLHQVRAHLAYDGLPVLGDDMYGSKRFNRRSGAGHICLWIQMVVFETGTGHEYEYMNGRTFASTSFCFPRCVYDEGLLDVDEE